jgi:anti-sigma regulatory factor (Ser/Thr protein kinase)
MSRGFLKRRDGLITVHAVGSARMAGLMSTPPTPHRPDEVRADDRDDHAMAVLPRDRRSAVGARDWLRDFLANRVPVARRQDALLVLSELATNALRHGLGEVVVRVQLEPDSTLQLSVTDSGNEMPELQPVDPTRIGGLGLRIVDELSSAWGVAAFPGGKTVWATLTPPT